RSGGEEGERKAKSEAALHGGGPSGRSRDSRGGASSGNADILQRERAALYHRRRPDATERAPMTTRTQPPFRADHVGSFLRPRRLLDARERRAQGEITAAQLRAVEDDAITEIVRFQEDVGLRGVTDGEFRRTYFHIDFLEQLGGVKTDIPVTVKKPDGAEELAPPVIRVIDKVRHAKQIQRADFQYLKSQVDRLGVRALTPKVTIPSPTMLHFRGGRAGISKDAYPELDPVFYDDVAEAYGDELRSLHAAGCR